MKKSALLLLLTLSANIYSQNLDSLYNVFINSRAGTEIFPLPQDQNIESSSHNGHVKCAFGLNGIITENFSRFTPEQQRLLKVNFSRPTMDTSIVSPSGKFRIHYNKSGSTKPEYSGLYIPPGADTLSATADSIAAVFDYVYKFEVDNLGYPAAPSDNTEGGDNAYDVYIQNLPGYYGETIFETQFETDKYITYLRVDNNFTTTYTKGFEALKVTAAHEYHHAIQLGNYGFKSPEEYYYEITSTAFEEFVYDDVNDYYNYMPNYFRNPSRTFSYYVRGTDTAYDFAIWNMYLKERFGYDILKVIWEKISDGTPALSSIASAIVEYGSNFKDELNLFGQQIYFTGYRAASNLYFDEAQNYPLLNLSIPYDEPKTVNVNSNAAANNYLSFAISAGSIADTIVSVITNSDISKTVNLDYSFLDNSENGAYKIINNYYYKINSADLGMLTVSNIFNNEPVIGDISKEEIDFAFPQPFNYSKHSTIFLPAAPNPTGQAFINIYSVSMDLVYSGSAYIIAGNQIKLKWNGLDKNNEKLPTGVYIYVTKSDDNIKKGKIVIYNE